MATQLSQLETNYDRLSGEYANLKRILDITIDPDVVPELPPMHGSVLVVDPKWNFVVFDLGETNGLLKNGILIITRGGKLVGKAKVRRIESNRSIADLLPEWRLTKSAKAIRLSIDRSDSPDVVDFQELTIGRFKIV